MALNLKNIKIDVNDPAIKAMFQQWKDEDARLKARIERFHNLYKDRLDDVVERLTTKYESAAYRNKEYRLGYEPRETLLWFLLDYAEVHCKTCKNKKYYNMFTGRAYYIGSYVIQVMHGQGSVIRIDKK